MSTTIGPRVGRAAGFGGGWADGRGDGAEHEGHHEQHAGDRQAAQDADVVGEEADGRRPGQEGHVTDRGDGADPAGRVPGVVGGGADADRKPLRRPEPEQQRPGQRGQQQAARLDQQQAGQRGGGTDPQDRDPPVAVDEGGAEPAAGRHRDQEDGERQGAERGMRVVAADDREAEPVVAGPLGEGHAQHEQADEQGPGLGPGGERAAPRRRPVPGIGGRRGGGVGEEAAGRDGHGGRDHERDREQVHRDRHAEGDHGRPGPGPGHRADAPPGVEPGHDRPGQHVLDGGALHVHPHVPGAAAVAEQEQPGRHRRDAVPVADRDGGHAGRGDQRHHGDGPGVPEPGDDQPGQRSGDGRADRYGQQDEAELAGGDPQPVAYLRDAGGPAGEDEAVGDEGGVDGAGGAADLRPGPSGRLRVSDVTGHLLTRHGRYMETTGATTSGTVPARAQVVIVGGGVTGCSIAYHLAHLGWTDVVLLEQHQLTAGTTWHAAGLITSAGMTDETALFFSRYSRDLYARLEAETGHSTGFRAVGHLSLATTRERQDALRREAAWMHGFGVEDTEISPSELAAMWPLARTDDVLSAFYVADEGRADPVGVATSLAKGARQLGVRVIEGVAATGTATRGRRVGAVLTEAGPIETEIVVNAAGMWARQFGALAGVAVPLQAAEHYYLLTDTVPGMDADLPVIEDPDNYGYYRPEGDGMLVGLFEPVGAPWSLDGVARDFAFGKLPPDWERMEPYLARAMERIPSLAETGVRTFFCGPESFTADVRPLLGPAPELDGYFVAAGLNSLGILSGGGVGSMVAHWIVDGVPPVDATAVAIDRTALYETSRRFRAERTVEQLGVLFGDAVWPSWQPSTARNVRRSVLHDRLAAAGAHFGVSAGWEYPEWFADGQAPVPRLDYRRPASHAIVGREHAAIREAVGVIDMSLMAKLIVQGPGAAAVLSRLSANDVLLAPGRLVYTQWLNESGGIIADVTVTWLEEQKFLVIASDIIHRRIEPLIRRAARDGEVVTVTDVTSGTTLLTVQGPASRELIGRLTDADLSNDAFGYLTARHIYVGYAPVLAIRVTYVGELV